jgi:hypothetical protein
MTKTPLTKKPMAFTVGVRFSQAEKIALEKCAKADERLISVMLRKLVTDGLKARGFLK